MIKGLSKHIYPGGPLSLDSHDSCSNLFFVFVFFRNRVIPFPPSWRSKISPYVVYGRRLFQRKSFLSKPGSFPPWEPCSAVWFSLDESLLAVLIPFPVFHFNLQFFVPLAFSIHSGRLPSLGLSRSSAMYVILSLLGPSLESFISATLVWNPKNYCKSNLCYL